LTVLIILGVVCSLHLITSDTPAQADTPFHSLEVSLFPPELTAKVTETELGAVTFGGNVTVEKPQAIAPVTVTLFAVCGRGWPTIHSPTTMEFTNPGTHRFQVTVVVPPGTIVSSATVVAKAHAESTVWEAEDFANAIVHVGRFIKMDVWTDSERYDTSDGFMVTGKLFINNSGNGEESFRIEMDNDPKAVERFDVNEGVIIPPFTMMEVEFAVHIKEDYDIPFEGEIITVVIKVTSITSEDRDIPYSKTHPIFIEIQGFQKDLEENWPKYIAYGVGGALAIVIAVFILRKRRERLDQADEKGEPRDGEDLQTQT
jgi:hypothetical protein